MCRELRAAIDEETGDIRSIELDGFYADELEDALALVDKLAGAPSKLTKRDEYHKPLVKLDVQEKVK